ncbi:hypothetical protein COW99_05420 [Candidatus Roizmanbacteria bacterium CG22_combo_CG10-13_8_21_14_all_38_20]|uniref:Septum formation initiator n=1 Tax=Candidatus Roizmanbacteria bacterium CG22_combo_CG10-13_8_21_14_all_38_20 TaxID=1974862 RepID=A0A2H0BVX8_9BACT|nr:hypothetical protein [Candidatus Microgenomates bacterium]PIP61200.1 MAG: hypothetical protein COW99_05420 [Candidatus Roizmanbacteria bacterium CG22_combo_CG10-13_8_21_14_all_38_20]PJC31190.1 MAG: hypothetical protein CO050_04080 [Candidatus Roizmanbacteria bacterium CG_4_9_14_0_2_um_filter_38_17]
MNAKTISWIIIIIGIVLIVNLSRSIIDLSTRSQLVNKAQERLHEVQEENALLREEYQHIQSREYIEEIAREKLGLGKAGETAYVIPQSKSDRSLNEKNMKAEIPIWREWLNLFL